MRTGGRALIYVDIPTVECIGNEDGAYKNVAHFEKKADAVKFCQDNFSADENGNVCLISGEEEL
jgi:hypothetical protein